MSSFQDKINSLSHLYSPTTVEKFKEETNKIVEILKEFPQLVSPQDVDNIQNIILKEYQNRTYIVDGGNAKSKYTEDQIVDFGDAFTINTQIGFRYGVFNKARWSFTNENQTKFSVIWVESNSNWILETRGDVSKFNLNPIQGNGNKLIILIYDPTKQISLNKIRKVSAKKFKNSFALLDADISTFALSDDIIIVLNKNIIKLTKTINSDILEISFENQKYSVFTVVEPEGAGTVTGGGLYDSGTQITVTATAAQGYKFIQWSDGVETNPRNVTVVTNITYTAIFAKLFTITTLSNPVGAGTITGGGTYEENKVINLQVTANSGYQFNSWDDGNTSNPRSITVIGNKTYTANFDKLFTITTAVTPTNTGTVTGGGTYKENQIISLTAIPAEGYVFQHWDDNVEDNPRSITVTENKTYTAVFKVKEPERYTISTAITPAGSGTVTGGGIYIENTQISLEASPNIGYLFKSWSDGILDNPRSITVTKDEIYTAVFELQKFKVTTSVNPDNSGTITGGGVYNYNERVDLEAIPNEGYVFSIWNDGLETPQRSITVKENVTYIAHFEEKAPDKFTITILTNPVGAGTVTGGGVYTKGTSVVLTATPNSNYLFSNWDDGNTSNPRTIIVNQDITYVADFNRKTIDSFFIKAVSEPEGYATVTGGGTYKGGTVVTLKAKPNSLNYIFDGWYLNNEKVSDLLEYQIVVFEDASYAARFHYESKFYIILKDQLTNQIFDVTTINFNEVKKPQYLNVNKHIIILNKQVDKETLDIETNLDWNLQIDE